MEIYKTIKNEAQDEFVERRSKFIGYIKPVQEEQEAIDFINEKSVSTGTQLIMYMLISCKMVR